MVKFYPNSFKDANGNIITSGNVSVKLTEMYHPGDMIANRATTMAGGKVLMSGGQINMTASMNGHEVFANKYGVQFLQPAASSAPMSLFYGSTNNTNNMATWTNGGDTAKNGTMAWGTGTSGGQSFYIFDSCSNFGWTNCDAFGYTDSPKTSVSVVLPDGSFTPTNTQVYLVLPDTKTVMSTVEPGLGGESYDAKTNTINIISERQTDIVPVGVNYKLVVIAKKNGSYYYFESAGTVTPALKQPATMVAKTNQQIVALLGAL